MAMVDIKNHSGVIYVGFVPTFCLLVSGTCVMSQRGGRKKSLVFVVLGLALAALLFQTSCGGGDGNGSGGGGGTPHGNYTVVITGGSGPLSHSATVTLAVQ